MKFTNSYHATLSTGANVTNTFLKKVFGLFKKDSDEDDARNGLFVKSAIDGMTTCEISVGELKELFEEQNASLDQLYDWVKNGKLKTVCDGIVKVLADTIRTGVKEGKDISKKIMSDED